MSLLRLFIIGLILSQVLLVIGVVVFSRKVKRFLRSRPSGERKGVLMADPVCGSMVEETLAEVLERDNRKYYFCSRQCREEFMEQ